MEDRGARQEVLLSKAPDSGERARSGLESAHADHHRPAGSNCRRPGRGPRSRRRRHLHRASGHAEKGHRKQDDRHARQRDSDAGRQGQGGDAPSGEGRDQCPHPRRGYGDLSDHRGIRNAHDRRHAAGRQGQRSDPRRCWHEPHRCASGRRKPAYRARRRHHRPGRDAASAQPAGWTDLLSGLPVRTNAKGGVGNNDGAPTASSSGR